MIIIKGGSLVGNRLWIFLALSLRHFFFKNKFKKRLTNHIIYTFHNDTSSNSYFWY